MHFEFYDYIGTVGVLLCLSAYALLQLKKLDSGIIYSLMNTFASILIVISLIFDFNLSAFLMESTWLILSLIGVFKFVFSKLKPKELCPES